MKKLYYIVGLLLLVGLVAGGEVYTNNYIKYLTRGEADSLYCLLTGCTFTGNIIINGNLTVNGDFVNITTVNYNVTNNIMVGGNITAKNVYLDQIMFNTSWSNGHTEGSMHWNINEGIPEVDLPGGEVSLQIGQESQLPRSTNKQGESIYNGQVVYISNSTGTNPEVKLVNFSNYRQVQGISGMVTQTSITDNQKGYYTSLGIVRELDTSMCNDGQSVFGNPKVLGNWTCVFPPQDEPTSFLGIIINSHSTEGEIWFNPEYLPKISDLSYVNETSEFKYNNSVLEWINDTGTWEFKNKLTNTELIYGSLTGNEIGLVIISSSMVYYNVTNISSGLSNGFIFNNTGNSGLTAQYDGTYEINSGWSFSGGANTEYHLRVAINNVAADNCHAQRKIGTGGDVGSASTAPCIVNINVGDVINLQIENVDNTNNAFIHDIGLTIVRISD